MSKPTTGADVDGDIDIAIVYSEPRVTDAIHDLLWMVRATILCSPKLLETVDRSDPAKFIAACDLLPRQDRRPPRFFFWEMLARSIGRPDLAVDRGLVFDTEQLSVQYATQADGLALADPLLFAEEIKAGRLAQPFDLSIDEGYGYYLTTHPEDLSNEITRASSFNVRVPPTRSNSLLLQARNSLACSSGASSPISSRKTFPLGDLEPALLVATAPVKSLSRNRTTRFPAGLRKGGAVDGDERPRGPRAVR